MDEENYSVGEGGDEGGGDALVAPPKKGLAAKIKGMPLPRKILIGVAAVAIVFLPADFAWKSWKANQSETALRAMKENAARLKEQAAAKMAKDRIVPNGFSTPTSMTESPPGQTGFPSPPGGSAIQSGGGCQDNSRDLAAIVQKIDRIEKIVETSTVEQAIMRKNLASVSEDMPGVKNTLAAVNQRAVSLDGKIGKFCASSAQSGYSSSPMQDYTSTGVPIRQEVVAMFNGWRVLGASGEGAVLIDSQGTTHFVNKGANIGKIRVVSIDPDTGFVAFSDGEMVKP